MVTFSPGKDCVIVAVRRGSCAKTLFANASPDAVSGGRTFDFGRPRIDDGGTFGRSPATGLSVTGVVTLMARGYGSTHAPKENKDAKATKPVEVKYGMVYQ